MIGITNGRKDLEHNQTVVCGACGRYGRYQVFMTFTQLLLFFIPVFRWNRQYFVQMSCCNALYSLDPEVGARIARGEQVEILPSDLVRVQSAGYDAGGSAFTGGYPQDNAGTPAYPETGRGSSVLTGKVEDRTGADNAAGSAPAKIHKRCVICGYETDENFEYCPMCGQRF